jgi:hypothetical protein
MVLVKKKPNTCETRYVRKATFFILINIYHIHKDFNYTAKF